MSKRTTKTEESILDQVADGIMLPVEASLKKVQVVNLPIPTIAAGTTEAKNVGEYFAYVNEGTVVRAIIINNCPTNLEAHPQIVSPDERENILFTALRLVAFGQWKLARIKTHEMNVPENTPYLAGAKFEWDGVKQTWKAFDYHYGIGFAPATRWMSPGLVWSQHALNIVMSGAKIVVNMEADKDRLVKFFKALMASSLEDAMRLSEERIQASIQRRQDTNASKRDKSEAPTEVTMFLKEGDTLKEITLTPANDEEQFTVYNAEGKFMLNSAWRSYRPNAVKNFVRWSQMGYILERGFTEF